MLDTIISRSTGRRTTLLLVLANLIYAIMLVYSIPKVAEFSGGLALFDMSPLGYSYEQAMALLSALGFEGRGIYLSLQLSLDVIYPILFALSYATLMLWLINIKLLNHRSWRYLAMLPIVVCVFDYCENIGVWMMLTNYPEVSESLVAISSTFTLIKSLTTTAYFTALIAALLVVAFDKLFKSSRLKMPDTRKN